MTSATPSQTAPRSRKDVPSSDCWDVQSLYADREAWKKDLEKAGNIAEQIIEIAQKYKSSMSKRDQRRLKSLVKRFNKVD